MFRRAYDSAYDSDFRISLGHKLSLKADLHGTTLSHTTSLRQAYDVTYDLNDNRKRVVGLFYKKQFIS